MEKKKITKHIVGDVYCLVDEFLSKHRKENFKITGLEFSNLGAQGRVPLFDATYSKKGTIMAYWKDELQNCIVITAPEPGYEIKAPKCLWHFFNGQKNSCFRPTHLDVSHLDVSNTTDFSCCFKRFGFGEKNEETTSSKIIGLEAWDVSSGKNFDFMFDEAFPQNKSISLNLSSWRFSQEAKITFWDMFQRFGGRANKVTLDVSGWNTENVCEFSQMFKCFAAHAKEVELKGIEGWRLGPGPISLNYTFDDFAKASTCRLDLSGWSTGCTQKPRMENFSRGGFFKIKEPTWEELAVHHS